MKPKIEIIAILITLFFGCASAFGEDVAGLDIPTEWKPSHKQNGKTVSAVVKIIGVVEEPFPDPKTERQVFQSKALILGMKGKEYVPSHVRVYLFSPEPLKKNSEFRIEGELSISDSQVKGGRYPATIRVSKSIKDSDEE